MQQGFFEGLGGAFYNRGDIVVDGESYFSLNESSVGVAVTVAVDVALCGKIVIPCAHVKVVENNTCRLRTVPASPRYIRYRRVFTRFRKQRREYQR